MFVIKILLLVVAVSALDIAALIEQECKWNYSTDLSKYTACIKKVGALKSHGEKSDRYVVISSDTNAVYMPFTPLVSMVWKSMGYTAIVMLFLPKEKHIPGSKTAQLTELIREFTASAGGRTVLIEIPEDYILRSQTERIGQVSRSYAPGVFPFDDTDYVMTSDIDMFPVDKKLFYPNHDPTSTIIELNGFAYGPKPDQYAMCYLGANASLWKRIIKSTMTITNNTSILDVIHESYHLYKEQYIKPRGWNVDQKAVYDMVKKAGVHGILSNEFSKGKRLDRTRWPKYPYENDLFLGILNGTYKDAHSVRPAQNNLPQLKDLMEMIMRSVGTQNIDEKMTWFDNYASRLQQILYL